ncbi:hypothetical protein RRG08_035418 [Elysia crispata]|uniref:Sulfotransferase domain-containing protein n=1 Tax=Elysia crispata TaxID=231223 RepID=A0AAE0Y4G3_9GAST|nr:hypothetical protein RRG08_035418 [Elysia crispata]
MWNRCLLRRHRIVAGWFGALLCIVCLHLYFTFNSVEKSRTSGQLRKLKLKNAEKYHESESQRGNVESQKIENTDQDQDFENKDSYNKPGLQKNVDPAQHSSSLQQNKNAFNRPTDRREEELYTPPSNESPKKRLPQAILIGTGKCGTRALLEYLGMHPYVVHAAKEVHFFDRDENFNLGLKWYKTQMPPSYSNQMTIEKSPAYVEHERSAPEIFKMNKTVRLLWVVKDPVIRLMSAVALQNSATPRHFYLERVNGSLSIKRWNNAVNRGKYVVHLRKWLKFFPLSQIHILDGGALKFEPVTQIQMVETFLGLPPLLGPHNFYYNVTKGFYCLVPFSAKSPSCLGKSKGRKHPELNDTVKTLLYDYYRPYNEEFFKVLGRRFDWEPKDYT